MSLPELNATGDLPAGIRAASLDDVVRCFGHGTAQRQTITDRLKRVHPLAMATGFLDRLIVFGSFVSAEPQPNDVDVILVMRNDFRSEDCLGVVGPVRPCPGGCRTGCECLLGAA